MANDYQNRPARGQSMNTTTPGSWKTERDADGIVWLTIDKPGTSANVLSSDVLTELDALLPSLRKDPPRGVIVISGKKSGFIAGADIKEFTGITSAESGYRLIHTGQQVLDRLEALPCHYRIAVGDERLALGFPEVQLGIHPGFGGTVRSVRTVGVRPAMEMMLTGKAVRADKALRIGLVDRLVSEQDLRTTARDLLHLRPARRRAPFGE